MELLTNCPLCNSVNLPELRMARDRHYGIAGEHRMVCCADCSLVFLNPMYSEADLAAFYPQDYYAFQENSSLPGWEAALRRILGVRSGKTHDPKFAKPGTVLDLGCGSGWVLAEMRERGWQVKGVEPSLAAAKAGAANGLDIHAGTVLTAAFPAEHFDFIRSNHSFEHIPNANETLEEIWRILKPDGRLLIGVPNVNSPHARLFGQYWWHLGAPVHTFSYSDKTLPKMLEKHNFKVEHVGYAGDQNGVVGSIQIWLNRSNGRKSSDGAVYRSRILKVVTNWMALAANLAHAGDAIEVVASKRNGSSSVLASGRKA